MQKIDLNDLRVFERIADTGSFSGAARDLGMPKSSVSRSVGRLEKDLSARLFQRTARSVSLTQAGRELHVQCSHLLASLDETIERISESSETPHGLLYVSAGVGFGINILSELIPGFLQAHPDVDVHLDLTSNEADLIASRIDVAVRFGPMPDSSLVARSLGELQRHLCASPSYVARHLSPSCPAELADHDCLEMPSPDGRVRKWTLSNLGVEVEVEPRVRVAVNEALTIHRMVRAGAGIGVVSEYLADPDVDAGRLVRILPDWTLPSLPVSIVYPSGRELSPAVKAFVGFLVERAHPSRGWSSSS